MHVSDHSISTELDRTLHVYWIRHGLSAANASNTTTARKLLNKARGQYKYRTHNTTNEVSGFDPALAKTSIDALLRFREHIGALFGPTKPTVVFCSGLFRAIQTAVCIFYPHTPIYVINGIGELPLIDAENQPFPKDKQMERVTAFINSYEQRLKPPSVNQKLPDHFPPIAPNPKGIGPQQVENMFTYYSDSGVRVVHELDAVKEMAGLTQKTVVAAVSHSHFIEEGKQKLRNNQVLLKTYTPDRRFNVGCRQESELLNCRFVEHDGPDEFSEKLVIKGGKRRR